MSKEELKHSLCSNCHRLKTVLYGDHNGKVYIPNDKFTFAKFKEKYGNSKTIIN